MNKAPLLKTIFLLRRILLCALALNLVAGAIPERSSAEDSPRRDTSFAQLGSKVDNLHGQLSGLGLKVANGIDSFFGTERHTTFEENRSFITLRMNFDWIESAGVDPNVNVKVHLVLPYTENRLRLVLNEAENEGNEAGGRDAEDESNIALRWATDVGEKAGLSFDVGLRIRDWELAGFLRANTQISYTLSRNWIGRTTNSLYWYTDTGIRDDLGQYFDYRISDNFFFRCRTRIDLRDENDFDFLPEQKFTLYQRLGHRHALAYEALVKVIDNGDSPFDEEDILVVDHEYSQFQVRLRYRFNALFPWLHFELWPIASFPEERDYELTWAARFRVDITFGTVSTGPTTLGED